jgi:cytochrome c oxidase subunit 3
MPLVADTEELAVLERPVPQTGGPSGGGPGDPGWDDRGGGGDGDDDSDDSRYLPDLSIFGMRLMLVSITILFIVISIVYFALAQSAKYWEPIRIPQLLWFSTAIILASSWTFETARSYFRKRDPSTYTRWLSLTVLLGGAFLTSQIFALRQLIAQGLYLQGNPHRFLFLLITSVHGLHLLGGLLMLVYMLVHLSLHPRTFNTEFRRQNARNGVAALYWHWLAGLWIAMFVMLIVRSS